MASKLKILKHSNKKGTSHGISLTINGLVFVPDLKRTWPTRGQRDKVVAKIEQTLDAGVGQVTIKDLNPPAPLKPLGKAMMKLVDKKLKRVAELNKKAKSTKPKPKVKKVKSKMTTVATGRYSTAKPNFEDVEKPKTFFLNEAHTTHTTKKPRRLTKAQVAANPDQPSIDAANAVSVEESDRLADEVADGIESVKTGDDTPVHGGLDATADATGDQGPQSTQEADMARQFASDPILRNEPNDDAEKQPDEL